MKQSIEQVYQKALAVINSCETLQQLENDCMRYLQQIPALYDMHNTINSKYMNELISEYEKRRLTFLNNESMYEVFKDGMTVQDLKELLKNFAKPESGKVFIETIEHSEMLVNKVWFSKEENSDAYHVKFISCKEA